MARIKIKCRTVDEYDSEGKKIRSIVFDPIYTGSAENVAFFERPNLGMFMGNILASAAAEFIEGQEYYLDITPVKK